MHTQTVLSTLCVPALQGSRLQLCLPPPHTRLLCEDRIVVRQQRWSLTGGELWRQQRPCAAGAARLAQTRTALGQT
jgi:hypothetical protein